MSSKVSGAREAVSNTVSSARDTMASRVTEAVEVTRGAVQSGVDMTKSMLTSGVHSVMGSRVGQMVLSGMDTVLGKSEEWVDNHLPMTDAELGECSPQGWDPSPDHPTCGPSQPPGVSPSHAVISSLPPLPVYLSPPVTARFPLPWSVVPVLPEAASRGRL